MPLRSGWKGRMTGKKGTASLDARFPTAQRACSREKLLWIPKLTADMWRTFCFRAWNIAEQVAR
jgi:hypothetical protein